MRMKLSVPPESIDWVMELLMGERREPVLRQASQQDEETFGTLSHKIRTLNVPVPIRWLHLQFWFLLWSLLLD